MSSDIQQTTLGELLLFGNGRSSPERFDNGKFPVFGSNGLIGRANESNTSSDTIVVGRVGSYCGSVHFSHDPCWVTDNAIRANAKADNDPSFLYYLLKHLNLNNWRSGSGQPLINQATLNAIEVQVPFPQSQKAIGELIGSLDDRITLLRETNATLEAIAQALFKSWFVDFDPVRAKMEGRAPEGMDEATAALFPDGLEESALGLVPRGWRVGTLADLSDLNPESWTTRNQPATIAYVDLANTKDNEISSITDFDFVDAPSRARRVLRSGDTIVGTVRPGNRSFAFVHEPVNHLTGSTGFAVLRPSAVENTEFVFLAATQDASIEHLAHVADGGAYPAVRPDVVSGLLCIVPDSDVMKAFHAVAEPLLAKVSKNQKQAQTLATLRDTLLPRLISGQLRLPEADAMLENA
jgi:type I restriction enzyme S subunit